MALAIFDLDNTLLGGDSDHAWGEFLIQQGIVDSAAFKARNDAFYADYQRGELDIMAYLTFALEPASRLSSDELHALQQRFLADVIQPMLLPKAQALLGQHRQQGDYLLIITATNRIVTQPIADLLGVDSLLASEAEYLDGRYTGQPTGIPCYQHGKVERLHSWLADNPFSLDDSYFYSDSHNDLPLLGQVGKPVAVDPDERLRAVAKEKGWPVISLRDD